MPDSDEFDDDDEFDEDDTDCDGEVALNEAQRRDQPGNGAVFCGCDAERVSSDVECLKLGLTMVLLTATAVLTTDCASKLFDLVTIPTFSESVLGAELHFVLSDSLRLNELNGDTDFWPTNCVDALSHVADADFITCFPTPKLRRIVSGEIFSPGSQSSLLLLLLLVIDRIDSLRRF